jgi:hypothetical protein
MKKMFSEKMRDNVYRVSAKSIKPKKVVVNVESNLKAYIKLKAA